MEIFWVNEPPKDPKSLVIPGVPSLYERLYEDEETERKDILRCFMQLKSELSLTQESIDVDDLKPVEIVDGNVSDDEPHVMVNMSEKEGVSAGQDESAKPTNLLQTLRRLSTNNMGSK
jgi:hypothetical protein